MLIIPAIDIKDGQCVRLKQGDFNRSTTYADNPVDVALLWESNGAERIHIVDLDGSLHGSPKSRNIIEKLLNAVSVPIQIGGGIRNMETAEIYLQMGAKWIIIGTAALKERRFVENACERFGKQIIIGIDALDGMVATEGWTQKTDTTAIALASSFSSLGIGAIVYTDISRDGMQTGVNIQATKEIACAVDIPIIASGGVADISDIDKLLQIEKHGVMGVIIGKALYNKSLSLESAIARVK
ncbi:MAG: 1-(5-phosphoribosyl)-5-[(5-phosphoribosylamino)methylideneamino]imidazole-4-carboxamide isomerase [Deltaproteobacteria bacterium]